MKTDSNPEARQLPGFLLRPQPWPPVGAARLKVAPSDFVVEEVLPFQMSGDGEHLWLWVEKLGQNTQWVARQLAEWAGVRPGQVGYAGLKDRQALTRQWFSVHLPGRAAPETPPQIEGVRVLSRVRHRRKLNTGALSGNRFVLTLRQVDAEREAVERRLAQVSQWGFPNYFGAQRFGRAGANWPMALAWTRAGCPRVSRAERARHLSVLRSGVFNAVLASRVREGNWHRYVSGDVLMLAGSDRCFVDDGSEALARRVEMGDLHPTGPLPGEGGLVPTGVAGELERSVLTGFVELEGVWRQTRMRQSRRALRVLPQELEADWLDASTLRLRFFLPAGSYATVLVDSLFTSA